MQRLYERERVAADLLTRENDQILHFSLQSALPEGHALALNTDFGTLSYIVSEDNHPRLVMQEQFTNTEMSVLLPLLEMFPYYCPYEVMYASFYSGKMDERAVARCRRRLQDAQEEGVWDQEMRPVRGALSRTRLKLRAFGIDISSILATGYILMVGSATGSLTGL
jgi:hypothetical protein